MKQAPAARYDRPAIDRPMERFTISKVGHLIAFADPSGNPVLAMQYDFEAD